MTVTLTYDATLSRVQIDATSLAAADVATVERSTDGVRWTTVRGGVEVPVTAGVMATRYDYEFRPGVSNTYRVRGIETGAVTFRESTSTAFAANAAGTSTVTPTVPTSTTVDGDALFLYATIRNSGTGTVNTPTGWTLLASSGNVALFACQYVTGMANPTVSYTGGVANATISAKIYAFRSAAIEALTSAGQLNGSAQNVAYPAITVPADDALLLVHLWKQTQWTTVAALPGTGMVEMSDVTSALGDTISVAIDYQIQTTATNLAAGSAVVTGGSAAISRALVAVIPHAAYLNEQTAATTPTLTAVWLKSVMRPFLNRTVQPGGAPLMPIRAGRGDANEVVGRSLPIAVTDVAGSKAYLLQLRTTTAAEAQTMDYVIASGDVLFLHALAGNGVPAGGVYLLVENSQEVRVHVTGDLTHWSIPVREVVAPGPDVQAATVTHDTLLALYATFDDLLAANPTFDDLLALMGDPSEVIVP